MIPRRVLSPSPAATLLNSRALRAVLCLAAFLCIVRVLVRPAEHPHSLVVGVASPALRAATDRQGVAPRSRVGKVHAVFGIVNEEYERALGLHERHADRHGHPMFVLRERILSGLWSKPAFILSVILRELSLPEDQRLEWLMWLDADTVLMNPAISLESFLPPYPEFSYVNMLVSNDRNGLNNGVFLIRVNAWSIKLLSAIIAFHTFRPDVKLKYSEQSGMEEMIEERYWRRSVVHIPQVWLNAFPANEDWDGDLEDLKAHQFRPGGLQIHFASNRDGKRGERLRRWMDTADQKLPQWYMPWEETWYAQNVTDFWADLSAKRTAKGIKPITEEDLIAGQVAVDAPTTTPATVVIEDAKG